MKIIKRKSWRKCDNLSALLVMFAILAACVTETPSGNKSAAPQENNEKIDRNELVNRHNVVLTNPDTLGSLSVGNGEFAFTVDVSGLQSYPEYYEKGVSLGTMSQWA